MNDIAFNTCYVDGWSFARFWRQLCHRDATESSELTSCVTKRMRTEKKQREKVDVFDPENKKKMFLSHLTVSLRKQTT